MPSRPKPLRNRSVVITRAKGQSAELGRLLEESGAEVLEIPMIEIAPPDSWASLDAVIAGLEDLDWIIFTSTNGVTSFVDRIAGQGGDPSRIRGVRIAAVGNATAEALRSNGIEPDIVPDRFQSTALLPHLGEVQSGVRTAVIRAAAGREELIDELRRRGGTVTLGVAYQTRAREEGSAELRALLATRSIDCMTFTSPSTATSLFSRLDEPELTLIRQRICIASIGPTTSAALRELGLEVTAEARSSSMQGLHDAIVEHYAGPR